MDYKFAKAKGRRGQIIQDLANLMRSFCRGHDEEQAGVVERETRQPGAEAGGAGGPSEQRHHQPLRF